jgi:hypothetical protein
MLSLTCNAAGIGVFGGNSWLRLLLDSIDRVNYVIFFLSFCWILGSGSQHWIFKHCFHIPGGSSHPFQVIWIAYNLFLIRKQ